MKDSPSALPPELWQRHLGQKFPELQQLIRQCSQSRLSALTGEPAPLCLDHPFPDAFVYGSYQAMILMASNVLKIAFKSHFNISEIDLSVLGAEMAADPKRQDAITQDFFREHANLTAGAIKQALTAFGVIIGTSVPIVSSGFDEIVFSDTIRPGRLVDYWTLAAKGISFSCSLHVDIFDEARVRAFHLTTASANPASGDPEFL